MQQCLRAIKGAEEFWKFVIPLLEDMRSAIRGNGEMPKNEIEYKDQIISKINLSDDAFILLKNFVRTVHAERQKDENIDISDEFIDAFKVQFYKGTNTMNIECLEDHLEGDSIQIVSNNSENNLQYSKLLLLLNIIAILNVI